MNRKQMRFYIFAAAAMLLIPAAAAAAHHKPSADKPAAEQTDSTAPPQVPQQGTECYRVLDIQTGTVLEVPVREYLIGVVCAEMPASFAPEALKAQTVAAHTYAERICRRNRENPDPALFGADFSNDSNVYQAYYTEEQIREAFGSSFDIYHAKISAAVNAVCSELLYYENEPIVAAFHAMSAGKTENAETVWGAPLAYLVSVDSSTDADAPNFLETEVFSVQQVKEILLAADPALVLSDDPAMWFSAPVVSEAGTVIRLQAGSRIFSGQQIRTLFSLRSAAFTVSYAEDAFTFTTKGFGHAVGMSQYGANAMAQAGCSYQEILAHYYPGTVLQSAEGVR